jgi:hypothetical protein
MEDRLMAVYYVFMPKYIDITAEVDAPDSRHARTAYLDYLSRSGMIQWGERQAARRQIITKRMQPGEIQTDVKLEYGVREPAKVEELKAPVTYPAGVGSEFSGGEPIEITQSDTGYTPRGPVVQPQEQPQEQPQPVRGIFGGSPIIDLSRKSGGL